MSGRMRAELRGPLNPFQVGANGQSTPLLSINSELLGMLEKQGYYVVDNRVEIKPSDLLTLNVNHEKSIAPGNN